MFEVCLSVFRDRFLKHSSTGTLCERVWGVLKNRVKILGQRYQRRGDFSTQHAIIQVACALSNIQDLKWFNRESAPDPERYAHPARDHIVYDYDRSWFSASSLNEADALIELYGKPPSADAATAPAANYLADRRQALADAVLAEEGEEQSASKHHSDGNFEREEEGDLATITLPPPISIENLLRGNHHFDEADEKHARIAKELKRVCIALNSTFSDLPLAEEAR